MRILAQRLAAAPNDRMLQGIVASSVELPVSWRKVPLTRKKAIVEEEFPMFLPHDLIEAVVKAGRLDLLIGDVDLKSFWGKLACEAVPPSRAEHTIPIRLYGDDGCFIYFNCWRC